LSVLPDWGKKEDFQKEVEDFGRTLVTRFGKRDSGGLCWRDRKKSPAFTRLMGKVLELLVKECSRDRENRHERGRGGSVHLSPSHKRQKKKHSLHLKPRTGCSSGAAKKPSVRRNKGNPFSVGKEELLHSFGKKDKAGQTTIGKRDVRGSEFRRAKLGGGRLGGKATLREDVA